MSSTPAASSITATEPDELIRVQELVYELRVQEVMTPRPITVLPSTPLTELMEILRTRRISGAPVVEQLQGRLLGIISIQDLINALANHGAADLVAAHMTPTVVTVRTDDRAVKAINLFAQYGYGRLPVVDEAGALVGIVTASDITRGLLRTLNRRFQAEEMRRYRASHIFDDIASDETSLLLRYHVAPRDFTHGGEASSKVKRALERLGANPSLVRRLAITAYEAEMNLVIHATNGGELRVEVSPNRITLITEDDGPGIGDIDQAFAPGFTTALDWVRELGFGAGMGLTNIKRYSDSVDVESAQGRGTKLWAVFLVGNQA